MDKKLKQQVKTLLKGCDYSSTHSSTLTFDEPEGPFRVFYTSPHPRAGEEIVLEDLPLKEETADWGGRVTGPGGVVHFLVSGTYKTAPYNYPAELDWFVQHYEVRYDDETRKTQ